MADGFIVAMATDTATPPAAYWTGTSFAAEIDSAKFFGSIGAARGQAGELQAINTEEHIEAYPATLNIVHNPPLGPSGI